MVNFVRKFSNSITTIALLESPVTIIILNLSFHAFHWFPDYADCKIWFKVIVLRICGRICKQPGRKTHGHAEFPVVKVMGNFHVQRLKLKARRLSYIFIVKTEGIKKILPDIIFAGNPALMSHHLLEIAVNNRVLGCGRKFDVEKVIYIKSQRRRKNKI